MNYQAKIIVPFGVVGIRCDDDALTGISFLSATDALLQPVHSLAENVCEQLQRYFADADFQFSLPMHFNATVHQRKVWCAMQTIACGKTLSYGEMASELRSSAQAVGQACGANPLPIVIPCHRVVSKAGLGGFMRHAEGDALNIKRWLLAHEGVTR